MSEHHLLINALDRLENAVRLVEQAVARRDSVSTDARIHSLQDELTRMNDDRSQLGNEIDRLTAHSKSLEVANEDVGQRLDKAIEKIKTVLEAQ